MSVDFTRSYDKALDDEGTLVMGLSADFTLVDRLLAHETIEKVRSVEAEKVLERRTEKEKQSDLDFEM